jgi:hypothetical protein
VRLRHHVAAALYRRERQQPSLEADRVPGDLQRCEQQQ